MEFTINRSTPVIPALTTSVLGAPRVTAVTNADFGAFAGDLDR